MPGDVAISFGSSDPAIAARWNASSPGGTGILTEASSGANPLDALDAIESDLAAARRAGEQRRWLGFVNYELNRWIETMPPVAPDSSAAKLPMLGFWRADGMTRASGGASLTDSAIVKRRSMSRDRYLAAVRRAIEYIAAGDVFQVNLAQQFDVLTTRSAAEVSFNLQHHAPAIYGASFALADVAIVSNSPELFFRIEPLPDSRRRITTRPIKGTRPRGPGMRDQLERSAKDKAELAMIVDLERNDLGRICEIGSVRVVEPRVIEEHPTLYHGVATIEGFLRPDVTLSEVFRAMFPCGSITGCPKVRAMEIIDELEGTPRGPYCGAIGYVDADGSAEFSVAIRTMTLANGIARVSVGGGIVADSVPEDEYRETIDKARAMLSALGMTVEQIDALRAE